MATFTGTIKKSPLEGGIWQLRMDDGTLYQLQTDDAGLLVEDQQVTITGEVDKAAFGLGMTGPTLVVSTWQAS